MRQTQSFSLSTRSTAQSIADGVMKKFMAPQFDMSPQPAQEPVYGVPPRAHTQTPQASPQPAMYAENTQKQASYPGQSARKSAMQNFLTKGATFNG